MKNLLLSVFMLFTALSFSQKQEQLDTFEALDSNIGATINIIKSQEHKIVISGNSDAINQINWEVDDKNLKIRSNRTNTDFDDVIIEVYTPSISVLTLTDGGKATMDQKFSRVDSFVVSATDGALVDLSNIEFKTLVAQSSSGGQILYKSANTLVSTSKDGSKTKSIQK